MSQAAVLLALRVHNMRYNSSVSSCGPYQGIR
jgi:hypothetical protein